MNTSLDDWFVQTKSVGAHLLLERDGMPGLIHLTADADSLRVGLFRQDHASLAASIEAGYQDLRSKPRLLVVQEEEGGEIPAADLPHVATSESIELGEWRLEASQIVVDDYRRHCLEIRHLGRPGMIHVGADGDGVSVEVWNHAVEHVVEAACVTFEDMRRSGRVS